MTMSTYTKGLSGLYDIMNTESVLIAKVRRSLNFDRRLERLENKGNQAIKRLFCLSLFWRGTKELIL